MIFFVKICKLVIFLVIMFTTQIGAKETSRAKVLVSKVKEIVRGEGDYSEVDVSNKHFAAAIRIAQLADMKSPEGVAGLIDVMLDPGFIEFDRKYGRTNNGAYSDRPIDPYGYSALMVTVAWELIMQPLEDEAVIPQTMLDKSRGYRLNRLYILDRNALVADCTAWCREVQAGRMTFQMVGSPTRYNHYGKAVSDSDLSRKSHSRKSKKKEDAKSVAKKREGGPSTWIYVALGLVVLLSFAFLMKQRAQVHG